MSSSGLIYAAIVGAWAAYLVPMWLRRQDELNEGRHTERFTTAIRILSRRGALERRYARMIANGDSNLDTVTSDVPARVEHPPPEASRTGRGARDEPAAAPPGTEKAPPGATAEHPPGSAARRRESPAAQAPRGRQVHAPVEPTGRPGSADGAFDRSRDPESRDAGSRIAKSAKSAKSARTPEPASADGARRPAGPPAGKARDNAPAKSGRPAAKTPRPGAVPPPRRGLRKLVLGIAAPKAPAPLRRPDGRAALLARRRRVVVGLFLAFTAGAVLAGLGGMAWLWLPALPGAALTVYIGYLRVQEHRRYEANLRSMRAPAARPPAARPAPPRPAARKPEADEPRRSAPAAPRRRPAAEGDTARRPRPTGEAGPPTERPAARPAPEARPKTSRREAEDRDHAEWIAALQTDTADARDRDAWDPVPVPLPTYVTAPVVPRGEPALPEAPEAAEEHHAPPTPLFDQYAEEALPSIPAYEPHEWPRAGNE
ncbi:hypothetical protein ACPA54_08560 [Uniformispora flossi]|uniref:hypothetical protein n=1 Tax=Uniformispora flossi TaxID=3390723 RepID=UPI003C2E73EF